LTGIRAGLVSRPIVLVLFLFVLLQCNLFAQQGGKILLTISVENASPVDIFKEIEAQSEVRFIYNTASLDSLDHNISLNLHGEEIDVVLSQVKNQSPLKFKQTGNLIAVAVKKIQVSKVVLSGIVTDAATGEHLISASIYNAKTYEGAISNSYGFYSLKQKPGKVKVTCSYLGYKTFSKVIDLTKDLRIDIALEPSLSIEEVIISGNTLKEKIKSTQLSIVELPLKSIKNLPVLLGETDVIKSLKLMPGVQGGTEGGSGLYVRGGSADQNLILLDGVPVYNVNHLFGIFSVFNGDALNSVTMYKGGFPARYGGRLSSIVDIRMKEGNTEKIQADATIGLLSSKATIDGPISDKTTFLVSGRRSYYDLFSYPIQVIYSKLNSNSDIWAGYYFYDLNAKISHRLNENNRFYLSAYTGADNFFYNEISQWDVNGETNVFKDKIGIKWGNISSSARWNHIVRNDLFSNLTLTYTHFKFKVLNDLYHETNMGENLSKIKYLYEYLSQIQDCGLKYDFDYIVNSNHYIRFGASGTFHFFSPGVLASRKQYSKEFNPEISDTIIGTRNIPSFESHAYIEDDFKIGDKLKFNFGLHHSSFQTNNNFYQSLEPRLSGRWLISRCLSFKLSYATMKQYLLLLVSNSISLPTDLWIPVEGNLKPQQSWQTAGGLNYSLNNKYFFSLEGYYKEMNSVTEYKEGSGIFNAQGNFTNALTQGYGESYGIEFYAKKSSGKTSGWINYTLSWANRCFDDIGGGEPFSFKYDRRHQLNIIVEHKINKKWNFGANWIFGSGYPFTLAEGKFININDLDKSHWALTEAISNRNNYRMPNYHRLDINFNYKKIKKQRKRTWSFGAYNSYFHQNPFLITSEHFYNSDLEQYSNKLYQTSFLIFVPYFRWNINFSKIHDIKN
jgi:hypothetical protein